MEVPNRLVMPPIGTEYATPDGFVTDRLKSYYQARARGGVGLIIVEVTCIDSPGGICIRSNLCLDDDAYTRHVDEAVDEIQRDFLKPDLEAVMETVGPGGEVLDHFDGRMLNPGHAIEAAWFILHEARCRGGDRRLIGLGTTILDWMWKRGWDREYGGILYFRDLHDKPVQEYWHDMKFWWPQNEAIIATLLAHQMTGDETYAQWHAMAHEWAYRHFPDAEHGEWFGYLHRDGRLSTPLKGNLWKGPFHLPRMQWYCWKLLEQLQADASQGAP